MIISRSTSSRIRNPFEFEPEDEGPSAAEPTHRKPHVSWLDSDSDSEHDEPAAEASRSIHTILAKSKAHTSICPPSPSVYSFRTHRRSNAISLGRRDTPLIPQEEVDNLLRLARPPSAALQPPSESKGKGVTADTDRYVPERDTWKTQHAVEVQSDQGEPSGAGAGAGGARADAAGRPSLEDMVKAGLRGDGDEEDDAKRNTGFYGFYDDILNEERAPAMPNLEKKWM